MYSNNSHARRIAQTLMLSKDCEVCARKLYWAFAAAFGTHFLAKIASVKTRNKIAIS